MIEKDFTHLAIQGYILNELEQEPRTVQYFTEGFSEEGRREYIKELRYLESNNEIVRRGNIFRLPKEV